MLNAASALCFLGLLALASAAALAPTARRRACVRLLVAYAVAASAAAGLTQHDAWPFAKWPMAGGLAGAEAQNTRIVAVDAAGAEHPVDARAWEPLQFDELVPWAHRSLPRLPPEAQDRAAAYLLQAAEAARARARAGGPPGRFARFLGPLAAPSFNLHPRLWNAPAHVPSSPFVRLRVYRERWNQEERRRDPARVQRTLLLEYPR